MFLKHVALVCNSEGNSDKFYGDILGLEKVSSKTLLSALAKQIFDIHSEFTMINYADDNIHFEIFIGKHDYIGKRIEHVCLEVADLEALLNRCRAGGVKILQVPKGDRTITFIEDFDGNQFEMKESK